MTPEEIYLEHLREIERIAAFVARKHGLKASDAEEFIQVVRVKVLENDYAIIRKFQGLSQFTTYLTTVIKRLYNQWRDEQWGKWRPSAEAKRLGDKAITLERLIWRDGFTWSEAVGVLTTPASSAYTMSELEAIFLRLPHRNPRPVAVPEEAMPEVPVEAADAYEQMEASDRVRALRHAVRLLDDLITRLEAEDRLMLRMRFCDARKVPDIALTLRLDQKKLYKRFDRIFDKLRESLGKAGVSPSIVADLLVAGDEEIRLNLFRPREKDPAGPSHDRGGDEVKNQQGRRRK